MTAHSRKFNLNLSEISSLALLVLMFSGCATTSGAPPKLNLSSGPKGAPWTILCLELSGPTRMQNIQHFAEALRQTPEIRPNDVFTMDESDQVARLYYGTYYRSMDRKTGKREIPDEMRRDLDLVRNLGGPRGERYFIAAIPVRMPQPDVGNPHWKLTRASGVYTLQVAAFEPTDEFAEFKAAAAEYCAFLRKEGYEAYYHHTPAMSMVTVGSFGHDAVYVGADQRNYYSEAVSRLQNDERLRYNLVNGGIVKVKDDSGKWIPVASRLVLIPKPQQPLP